MRLRKYFETDPAKPLYFRNIRGAVYVFSPTGGKEGLQFD
jgi:DNA-binding response OmpR family regulator